MGNLRAVALPDGSQIGYLVDGEGDRVGKTVNSVLVRGFLYDGGLSPIAELDANGNVVSRFIYAGETVPAYMIKDGVTYRIITDHLGSPRLVVDVATGTVAQQMDYDEFGNVLTDTNPGFQPFGFAGGLYDRDTGLERFGVRDYDPRTGRWTTKDVLLFEGNSTNLYGYTVGDPVNLADPSGLDWQDWNIPPPVVDAAAGFGDGVSLGLTGLVNQLTGADAVINSCSSAYLNSHRAGSALTLLMGAGRLAYAGLARLIPLAADASEGAVAQALEASALRNTLKVWFRGDIKALVEGSRQGFRMYNPAQLLATKYGGDAAAMLAASGRTNASLNALALAAVVGSVANNAKTNAGCGCSTAGG